MITQKEIENLGYNLKTKGITGNLDFVFQDLEVRPYLVCLSNNSIQIIYDSRDKRKSITFSNINDFIHWHNNFVN